MNSSKPGSNIAAACATAMLKVERLASFAVATAETETEKGTEKKERRRRGKAEEAEWRR